MRYQEISSGGQYPFPDHNINPKEKGANWCMQYAKAAMYNWLWVGTKAIFSSNGGDYAKYRMYALGKQPNTQYKKLMGVEEGTNNTQLVVDWSVRSIISGYRDKVISRLMREDYGIVCTPIDMQAKSEMDEYYAMLRTKLAMRTLLMQQNPDLASHPMISLQNGEPLDIEELELRMSLGEQFNRSMDAEMAIDLGFYENDYKSKRKRIYEDLFDLGVAGYKEWLGDDNKAKFRIVDPECVVISPTKDPKFKDIVHAGELIYVPLVELATLKDEEGNLLFTEKDLEEFAISTCGKFGNPSSLGLGNTFLNVWDKFKAQVFDIEFYTYNDEVYRDAPDGDGNIDFRKADYNRGKVSDKYIRKKIQYVYKCKWIVGTDKCYDWGKCYDQKRSAETKKKSKTKLSYSFEAYNFYNMRAQGFMERLVPYLDDYQLTMLKIQNFKNRAVPSGWWIDLSALESVAMNKGGKNMEPKELLQMFFETGVLLGRSEDEGGQPRSQNWKPVIPIENTAASELAMFYQDLVSTITAIEKMTGYNDVTMGQASSKTLVPGYETAQQATNEAIYPMAFAEESLTLRLAEDVLCRMQQGIKKGGISGYAPALNTNLLRFIEISPDIALRDYGIEIEKRTSEDQKLWLMQAMQPDIQNGFLDSSDAITLVNTKNAKQAQSLWAFKVKKRKEQMQQHELQKIKEQNEGLQVQQQMVAQQSAQEKQMQYQFELKKEEMRIMGELKKEEMRIMSNERIAIGQNAAKVTVADVTADAKVASTEVAGIHQQIKQSIANEKPSSTTSNK